MLVSVYARLQEEINPLEILKERYKDEPFIIWIKQNQEQVGKIFDEAQTILSSLGLSTDRIDQLNQIAHQKGCLGFKLSGGGLGGIVIALCLNSETAEKIAQASKDLIDHYWVEEI